MARTRTLADLRADVRIASDTEGQDPATGRHPDAELTRFINQGWQAFRRLVSECGDTGYMTASSVACVPHDQSISVPVAAAEIFGVDITLPGGMMRSLSALSFKERNYRSGYEGIPDSYMVLQGSALLLSPTPDAAYPVIIWTLGTAVDLVADTDTIDGMFGAEDWIVFDAATRVLLKDGLVEEASSCAAQKATVELALRRSLSQRNHAGPMRRLDTWGHRRQAARMHNWWRWP